MDAYDSFGTPTLVVVTGPPGAGKTTLAHTLARALRCPLISRDEMKEGLVNTLRRNNTFSADVNGYVYGVYFDTLERLLSSHITLVTEAAFQHKVWTPKLNLLRQMARIRLICCTVPAELARTRYIERAGADPYRATFHDDLTGVLNADLARTLIGRYEPPQLAVPTMTVDTADGYSPGIEDMLAFIEMSNPGEAR